MVDESVKNFGSSLLPAMLSRSVTYKLHTKDPKKSTPAASVYAEKHKY